MTQTAKRKTPDTFAIILSILVLAAVMTWIIPGGEYARVEKDGRTIVDPTSFQTVEPQPQGIGGGTVAAYARHNGYPAAVWATLPGNAHQPNEQTSIANIVQDAKVMAQLALSPA